MAFDTMILGASHMYKGFGTTFDPEGLFSSFQISGGQHAFQIKIKTADRGFKL